MNKTLEHVIGALTVCATLAPPAFAKQDALPPAPPPSVAPDPQPITPSRGPWPSSARLVLDADDDPETLVGGKVTHGAFGGPSAAYTRLRGEDALLVGARGGWLINHRLVLGGAGYGLTNRVSVPKGSTPNDADYQLGFGYGGVWLEYVFAPSRLVHASIGTMVGAGGLSYVRFRHEGERTADGSDAIFVLEPVAGAEINVTKFLRVGVFASYRAVSDVDLSGLATRDLRGFSGGTTFKFGLF
jgi:hypothetical protein